MSGTLRFDDDNIIKVIVDPENLTLTYEIKVEGEDYTGTVTLGGDS